MRVINLKVENFLRLVAVDITPAGDIVTLTGKNAQGKSSVLTALWAALAGKDAAPDVPVHKGAREAKIRVDLGRFVVTRKFRLTDAGEVTTSLAVESADGQRFSSPQKMLDELIGAMTFDPLEFARMKPRDQFDALAALVPTVDFDEIANKNRGDYENRTDINRRAREARAAASVIAIPTKLPERVDEQALVAEMASATQREQEIAAHGQRLQDATRALDDNKRRLAEDRRELSDLEDRIADLKARIEAREHDVKTGEDLLNSLPAPPPRIDVSAVAEQLNAARETNRQLDEVAKKREQKASLERMAAALEKESDELTARIGARNAAKEKAISEAKMPVPGITFGDGEILLNGVPFAQGSSAEQLRTSVAIAAALNPKLRVIHVRDGSLLDDGSLAWLATYAHEHDLQVWVEQVSNGDGVGFIVEDGHIKAAETAERAA
ncbi:MAG TPA: AAA family ATPase [Dokdonella sp.]|nr:AAA family ATPase [Dokdonella sp.]